jgi:hypothetical protein
MLGLSASNKQVLRFHVDLATTAIPTGTTSTTTGYVIRTLNSEFPTSDIIRVTLAGLKAVTAVAGVDTSAKFNVFLQKNGGNNVDIPSSGDLSLTATATAIAVGSRDIEIGDTAVTKIFMRHAGANVESLKLVLAVSSGAASVAGTASGILEILLECEVSDGALPRA